MNDELAETAETAESSPHVLFATAELRPLVSAGGLGEAASGLVAALRGAGVEVTIALPDYFGFELDATYESGLDVPEWAGPASVRVGDHPEAGRLALVSVAGIERPDPYVDENGYGWSDNTDRFAAFSAAVGSMASSGAFDVLHVNDWHTALAPAFVANDLPTMLTIHNLGHQGFAHGGWMHRLPNHRESYSWGDGVNSLAGAIQSVDRVTTVSPNYAQEILSEANGMGLHVRLRERSADLVGIRNGIDSRVWDPSTDEFISTNYDFDTIDKKQESRRSLSERAGFDPDSNDPIIVIVSRLVEQKGMDLAFEAARYLEGMKARMVVLGSGDRRLADWGRWLQSVQPDRFWFYDGYDAPLSHQLFAGGDLLLMPSRFEPCGLAQMQAMAYGTIPVVTGVGGLADTVSDDDQVEDGNGFITVTDDAAGVIDALHRAVRAVRHAGRKKALQRRGMTTDWSWAEPAQEYIDLYRSLVGQAPPGDQ